MPENKISKALKLDVEGVEVELVGREDSSMNAAIRSARIQSAVAKMVLLGKKRGRPNSEEVPDEEAA